MENLAIEMEGNAFSMEMSFRSAMPSFYPLLAPPSHVLMSKKKF